MQRAVCGRRRQIRNAPADRNRILARVRILILILILIVAARCFTRVCGPGSFGGQIVDRLLTLAMLRIIVDGGDGPQRRTENP